MSTRRSRTPWNWGILRDERLLGDGYLSASTVRYLGNLKGFTRYCALGLLEVQNGGKVYTIASGKTGSGTYKRHYAKGLG